jgi:pimeloyl-ACP methyl ester carboxylesterase
MMRNHLKFGLVLTALLLGGTLPTAARPIQQATATAPAAASLATAPDKEFTADGVTLRYRDLGEGDPIIFIHGYTATLESMIGLANAMPPNFRRVAVDLRGFGRSSKFADPARFGQAMADDVVRLMDHLKITRAHLVGHSLGALVSANVASRYPTRVSSAALIAGPFWVEPKISEESKRWTTDLENGTGLTNFVQWLLPFMSPQMATATNAGMMKANDLGSLTASMKALPSLAIAGLSKDGDKALVIAGTADPLFATSPPFAKLSPGSQLVEVAGANHVSVLTHAETVKAITAQLAR